MDSRKNLGWHSSMFRPQAGLHANKCNRCNYGLLICALMKIISFLSCLFPSPNPPPPTISHHNSSETPVKIGLFDQTDVIFIIVVFRIITTSNIFEVILQTDKGQKKNKKHTQILISPKYAFHISSFCIFPRCFCQENCDRRQNKWSEAKLLRFALLGLLCTSQLSQ